MPWALGICLAAVLAATPAHSATAKARADAPAASTNVRSIADSVTLPYETFTLANGLRVIVHTDRKAPVVAVAVWYHVGSKDEPPGKAGFAHLFEHLMFNGSEHAPTDYFEPLQQIGATDVNGTTYFDRTNYFETVPTPALERILFLESDRMGYLLGALDQTKVDNQRGVVENEKRQGDNKPYGLVEYAQLQTLFPEGHPYHHPPIGSVTDLDQASMPDVKQWFRAKYGPTNAVLVLSGDVDVATARRLVERYFGGLPRGPAVKPTPVTVPTLAAPVSETIHDRVALTRLYRMWAVPGYGDKDAVPLDIAATVIGGLSSSRLDNALVRDEQLAASVSASFEPLEGAGLFEIEVNVKPGVDPEVAGKRLDEIVAKFIAEGPTPEEMNRVATRNAAGEIGALETVSGQAAQLAEGMVYANDPGFDLKQLRAYATTTPGEVRDTARKWLSRPVYALTIAPGPRQPEDEARAERITGVAAPIPETAPIAFTETIDRSQFPPVGTIADLTFPKVAHARLSNGVELVYAQRSGVPKTLVALTLDAGFAADPLKARGTTALMTALLTEGTTSLSSVEIAQREEDLGASISAGASRDRTGVTLSALSANLAPSLDLFADLALHPAFAPAEVERVRGQQLARIAAELTNPQAMAARALAPILYGANHPYGGATSGDPEAVKAIAPGDLAAFHKAWFRPDKAKLFVVSDRPLNEIQPLLDARFGNWHGIGTAGAKSLAQPIPSARPRIVLIDRKDSPQSLIVAGAVLPLTGADDRLPLETANDVVAGSFLSRLNTDIRETKGWSYGVGGGIGARVGPMIYQVSAPVQSDKTGESIAAMREDFARFLSDKGVTHAELERNRNGAIRELTGSFETGAAVLGAMEESDLYRRPDDYYALLPARYRAMTTAGLDQVARTTIKPDQFTWVVVGDAAVVRPQLEALGLPIETMEAQ